MRFRGCLCSTNLHRNYSLSNNPLRVLFAGSDEFSAISLRALYHEHTQNKSLINSIDVLCKIDGRTGRRLNILKEVPVKSVARSLGLRIYTVSDFQDFNLPESRLGCPINLLIAVSFGLFIPSSVISKIEFGGLNVHPSLLPMYRGAAPIHHTLLDRIPISGVTIQTLDQKKFDHGKILMQSNPISIGTDTKFLNLRQELGTCGASMLIQTIQQRLFMPPIHEITSPYKPSIARKLTSADKRIDWIKWKAEDIERRSDVLETLWTKLYEDQPLNTQAGRRVLLTNVKFIQEGLDLPSLKPGCFTFTKTGTNKKILAVRCNNGWIKVERIQLDGKKQMYGSEWVASLQGRGLGKIFH